MEVTADCIGHAKRLRVFDINLKQPRVCANTYYKHVHRFHYKVSIKSVFPKQKKNLTPFKQN